MAFPQSLSGVQFSLPDLPVLRLRMTLRLLEDTHLPAFKGGMLRGGFGYAFQRGTCPPSCWGASATCSIPTPCAYRTVFETTHPPDSTALHNLQDIPRPFVIEPPSDTRTAYIAGETLEFGVVLLGRGIDYLPYFIWGFEQLGRMGLGQPHTPARLERVEALQPWRPVGDVIYQDGCVTQNIDSLPLYDPSTILAHAATLPADLRLVLQTPLRLKTRGDWLRRIDPPALVQAICWRLNALATFHGPAPWPVDHRALIEQARTIQVTHEQVQWVDWHRTSTRDETPRDMILGGILGSAQLHNVPPDIRTVLVAGSLVHVGKACVFGHGRIALEVQVI
ncbi:MAG: CRISPR system precrRNA processing endoribonuclease RAMP protein Cas6 [Herpetosiphonaceae bacterium]|nr:CRISPR system precrRNA processing endoribonuclease RAMP protein Cas6 [Herpetosiphonaceae bacterium]